MLVFIKSLAPTTFYIMGMILMLMALGGRTRIPLLFIIGLLPLRNVIDKLHSYPFGKDFR